MDGLVEAKSTFYKGWELNKTRFLIWWILAAGEAKNVDNAVVLARLFNEASGQKTPSKSLVLFGSHPLGMGNK